MYVKWYSGTAYPSMLKKCSYVKWCPRVRHTPSCQMVPPGTACMKSYKVNVLKCIAWSRMHLWHLLSFSTHGFNPISTDWRNSTSGMDGGEDGEWCNEPMEIRWISDLDLFLWNVFQCYFFKVLNNAECENKLCFLQINYILLFWKMIQCFCLKYLKYCYLNYYPKM